MSATRLHVDQLSKTFGDGTRTVRAVDGISLDIAPGEVVLVMGPSGSGKTTLLLLLGALLKPTAGTVALDGQELTALGENRLPQIRLHRVGFVFQDFNLLSSMTALENVAVVAELAGASGKVARARAAKLLRRLDLEERMHFLPEKLSGGEKQRVSIARALVNDPTLILADEPTANLDSRIGHDVMRLLQEVAKERQISVVIVSHDQRIKDIADRVLWLEDGRFRELAAMVVDPVCGMSIEQDRAVTAVVADRTYHFCSRGCRAEFLEEKAS